MKVRNPLENNVKSRVLKQNSMKNEDSYVQKGSMDKSYSKRNLQEKNQEEKNQKQLKNLGGVTKRTSEISKEKSIIQRNLKEINEIMDNLNEVQLNCTKHANKLHEMENSNNDIESIIKSKSLLLTETETEEFNQLLMKEKDTNLLKTYKFDTTENTYFKKIERSLNVISDLLQVRNEESTLKNKIDQFENQGQVGQHSIINYNLELLLNIVNGMNMSPTHSKKPSNEYYISSAKNSHSSFQTDSTNPKSFIKEITCKVSSVEKKNKFFKQIQREQTLNQEKEKILNEKINERQKQFSMKKSISQENLKSSQNMTKSKKNIVLPVTRVISRVASLNRLESPMSKKNYMNTMRSIDKEKKEKKESVNKSQNNQDVKKISNKTNLKKYLNIQPKEKLKISLNASKINQNLNTSIPNTDQNEKLADKNMKLNKNLNEKRDKKNKSNEGKDMK